MNMIEENVGNVTIVRLVGALDAVTAPHMDDRLQSLTAAGAIRLVLDLHELSYIASAGIRVLYAAIRETRRRAGDLRLVGLQPHVARTLELVGMVPTITVYGDVAAALDSFA